MVVTEGAFREGGGEGRSSDAFDAVAFLSRSEHRLRVFSLLIDGPRSRAELREGMAVTRVTLSRILGDLEDRGWVTRDPATGGYELTSFGELVYRDFTRLLGTVSVGQSYPDVVKRLPTEWFDFDLECLTEGKRVAPQSADPLSAARVVANAVEDADTCRSLLGTFISLPMYSFEAAIEAGTEPAGTVVFDAAVTETMLTDPDLRSRWQGIETAADQAVYYGVDERVPCSIDLVDGETVFLTIDREEGEGFDVLRCRHPDVVAWADETVESYRAAATPLAERIDGAE